MSNPHHGRWKVVPASTGSSYDNPIGSWMRTMVGLSFGDELDRRARLLDEVFDRAMRGGGGVWQVEFARDSGAYKMKYEVDSLSRKALLQRDIRSRLAASEEASLWLGPWAPSDVAAAVAWKSRLRSTVQLLLSQFLGTAHKEETFDDLVAQVRQWLLPLSVSTNSARTHAEIQFQAPVVPLSDPPTAIPVLEIGSSRFVPPVGVGPDESVRNVLGGGPVGPAVWRDMVRDNSMTLASVRCATAWIGEALSSIGREQAAEPDDQMDCDRPTLIQYIKDLMFVWASASATFGTENFSAIPGFENKVPDSPLHDMS